MDIYVPYIYDALIRKTPESNVERVFVKDVAQLSIVDTDSVAYPLAFSHAEDRWYWDGTSLWKKTLFGDKQGCRVPVPIDSSVIPSISFEGVKYHQPPASPFKNFWNYAFDCIPLPSEPQGAIVPIKRKLDDKDVVILSEIGFTEWISDNRGVALKYMEAILNTHVFVDGMLCRKSAGPTYKIASHPNAGTPPYECLFCNDKYKPIQGDELHWGALQKDEAYAAAYRLAVARSGCAESLPIFVGGEIEVFIPEAVNFENSFTLEDHEGAAGFDWNNYS